MLLAEKLLKGEGFTEVQYLRKGTADATKVGETPGGRRLLSSSPPTP